MDQAPSPTPLLPWLDALRIALRGGALDVPCGGCDACCRSGFFIHIQPDEAATLRRIPRALRFPAPGLPRGHVLLGYDERGRCPMLGPGGCTIYEDRPRTCRAFDCRALAVTELFPGDPNMAPVADRARRWTFTDASPEEQAALHGIRGAVAFLRDHGGRFPPGAVPAHEVPRAVLALRVSPLFMGEGAGRGDGQSEAAVDARIQQILEVIQASRPGG